MRDQQLEKTRTLNSLKVVNFGPQLGKAVYIYDLACSILYYRAPSQISLKKNLGIHPESCIKYVNTKVPYLGRFILLSFPVLTAKSSGMPEAEFLELLNKERKVFYDSGTRRSIAIILKKPESLNNKLEQAFPSLASCILFQIFRYNYEKLPYQIILNQENLFTGLLVNL